MDNFIAVIFDTRDAAFAGLHALWDLDRDNATVTVHGAAVIDRDQSGQISVVLKQTDAGARTAMGVALGTILGVLGGPVGVAAGIGTAFAGLVADETKSGEREEAASEAGSIMQPGQSAVIAEVWEDDEAPVDTAMKPLGGKIFRRDKASMRDMSVFGTDGEDRLLDLYPYADG